MLSFFIFSPEKRKQKKKKNSLSSPSYLKGWELKAIWRWMCSLCFFTKKSTLWISFVQNKEILESQLTHQQNYLSIILASIILLAPIRYLIVHNDRSSENGNFVEELSTLISDTMTYIINEISHINWRSWRQHSVLNSFIPDIALKVNHVWTGQNSQVKYPLVYDE